MPCDNSGVFPGGCTSCLGFTFVSILLFFSHGILLVFFLVVFCLLSRDDVRVLHGCFASYLGIVFMFFLVVLPPYLGIISMFLLVVLQWFCLLPRITVILFGCFASCLGVFGSFAFCLEFFSGQGAAGVATTGAAVSFLVSFHMAIPMNRK